MAESLAGETGHPFVNIDASMINTMGMGVLKVKLLFRKLRKYALKYGGVVAFFDEADALGNRGMLGGMPGQQGLPAKSPLPSPFGHADQCGGLGYVSDASRTLLLTQATAPDPDLDDQTPAQPLLHGHGRHGWRRRRRAPGAAHRALGAQEAARLRQPQPATRARHAAQAAADSTACSS